MSLKNKFVKLVSCTAVCAVAVSGMGLTAEASGNISSLLPTAGFEYTVSATGSSTSLADIKEAYERKASTGLTASTASVAVSSVGILPIGGILESTADTTVSEKSIERTTVVSAGYMDDLRAAANLDAEDDEADEEIDEEELFRNLVIAQVNNYVNVRDLPSEDGEIVGKLYNNSVGTYLEEEDGWYKISSGSVEGYVKGEYCVTGEDAIELAREVGTRIATVQTETLFVREEPSTDSSVVGMVPDQDELLVTDELDGWVEVDIEEGVGYVSSDYVTLSTEFVQAESIEEEKARLEKEAEARKAAQAAAKKASASTSSSSNSTSTITYAVSGGSEEGQAVANYALQFVGNPYVYGGTSLTNGADCSGFVMSVYAHFGVGLPHSSAADRSVGSTVGSISEAQPGDIICYSGHVGIYIGNGQIVHASTSRTGIVVSSATYRSILSIRRIF